MKNKILFLIALAVLNISAQLQLKVITYNIMGMKPGTDPPTRLYHIIQNLKVLHPDIIGHQEINESLNSGRPDNQAMLIADSLSSYFGIRFLSPRSMADRMMQRPIRPKPLIAMRTMTMGLLKTGRSSKKAP